MCSRLERAELACGAVLSSRPAHCLALTSLVLEQPALALSDVPGLAGIQRLHLGRRCEVHPLSQSIALERAAVSWVSYERPALARVPCFFVWTGWTKRARVYIRPRNCAAFYTARGHVGSCAGGRGCYCRAGPALHAAAHAAAGELCAGAGTGRRAGSGRARGAGEPGEPAADLCRAAQVCCPSRLWARALYCRTCTTALRARVFAELHSRVDFRVCWLSPSQSRVPY